MNTLTNNMTQTYTTKQSAQRGAERMFGAYWLMQYSIAKIKAGFIIVKGALASSLIEDASRTARNIASSMPNATRKEIVCVAIKAGVANRTARRAYHAVRAAGSAG